MSKMRASPAAQAHLARIRAQFPWQGGWILTAVFRQGHVHVREVWVGPEQTAEVKEAKRYPAWLQEYPGLTKENAFS